MTRTSHLRRTKWGDRCSVARLHITPVSPANRKLRLRNFRIDDYTRRTRIKSPSLSYELVIQRSAATKDLRLRLSLESRVNQITVTSELATNRPRLFSFLNRHAFRAGFELQSVTEVITMDGLCRKRRGVRSGVPSPLVVIESGLPLAMCFGKNGLL
jgi:hypothetical protein